MLIFPIMLLTWFLIVGVTIAIDAFGSDTLFVVARIHRITAITAFFLIQPEAILNYWYGKQFYFVPIFILCLTVYIYKFFETLIIIAGDGVEIYDFFKFQKTKSLYEPNSYS